MSHRHDNDKSTWPELPYSEWRDTAATLHLWTQIVGKIRLAQSPWLNHSWHVTLYVTPRGLTTGTIPHGNRLFRINFDFIDQRLVVESDNGGVETVQLKARDTAEFYEAVMEALERLSLPVAIDVMPNEIPDAIPFDEDHTHRAYDAASVVRFWQVLCQAHRVFSAFRALYWGKSSPVHFFWGSFDLAVTRFSGRTAPDHPGGLPNMPLWVAQEAYSHEVSSAGFWPGGDMLPQPVFYSYAYPTPEGFADAKIEPAAADWSDELGEFILPLDVVRESADPDATLMAFLRSTFDAAARLASWDLDAVTRRHFPAGG